MFYPPSRIRNSLTKIGEQTYCIFGGIHLGKSEPKSEGSSFVKYYLADLYILHVDKEKKKL